MNLGALGDLWAGFWESRTAREKQLLTWGGAVLSVFIAYSVLWAPAQEGRARLRDTLPAMQRQIAQMTAQANEARARAGRAGRGAGGRCVARGALRVAGAKRVGGASAVVGRCRADRIEEHFFPRLDDVAQRRAQAVQDPGNRAACDGAEGRRAGRPDGCRAAGGERIDEVRAMTWTWAGFSPHDAQRVCA